jgi:serpin B
MTRGVIGVLCGLGVLLVAAAGSVCAYQSGVDQRLVSANNQFGMRLFKDIAAHKPAENVFISPSSISAALSMTYNGAAGTTKVAMGDTLGLKGVPMTDVNAGNLALTGALRSADPKIEIETANSLWIREAFPIRPEFISESEKFYGAQVSGLRGAPGTINSWVKQHTHGKIEKLVDRVDPLTVMFLVNATYFKGQWTEPFEKAATHDHDFHLSGGETKTVPMMWQTGLHEYFQGDGFQEVRLPYGRRSMSMYIFLPDTDLQTFYAQLSAENLDNWMSQVRKTQIQVGVPRFKMDWSGNLNEPLKALGMRDAFPEGHHDFENMTPDRSVCITEVLHKSFLQVDETGTVAAAATSVHMGLTAMPVFKSMIVDRPFFLVIRHDTSGEILFMGAVADPGK